MNPIHDIISLFYPKLCCACGKSLFKNERMICTLCYYRLPTTNFHLLQDNPVSRVFWGRINLEAAATFLYFRKKGMVQRMIHELKYRKNKEIGYYLGELFGLKLNESALFEDVDYVIPVPLHKKKLRKRGYNQSEIIAEGICRTFNKKLSTDNLYRKQFSSTQTRKSRFQRWENVKDIFALKDPDQLSGMHILLIDDVITTGSTLEACACTFEQIDNIKISLAALAYTL